MSKTSFIQEEETLKKAPTLVRRVSDMFKADGNYSGPPVLFSQKILHCCENLNLFPYLLYSFENSKSHPLAKKVNLCINLIVRKIVEHFLFVYASLRRTALNGIQKKSQITSKTENKKPIQQQDAAPTNVDARTRFCMVEKPKPKSHPVLLIMAVYLAPLVLAFQLVGLFSLLVIGKYTPGFIFLVSSLVLLGFISMKVMFHQGVVRRKSSGKKLKRKSE